MDGWVSNAKFSPDGQRILAAAENTAKVWSASDGLPILTLNGHNDSIERVSFSSDGRRIVTASSDNTANVWDAADGRLLATLSGHRAVVGGAAFSPDGGDVVTAGWDATVNVWDVLRLTQTWPKLAHDACVNLLGAEGRRFSRGEIDADPLLTAEWPVDRDVCEGVENVPTIAELRLSAGL